jgi:hypothetical protein
MMNVDYINKNLIRLLTIIVILTAFPAGLVLCQQSAPEQSYSLAGQHKEAFTVFTDRNLYIVGEKILFTVYNLSDEALKEIEWSTVLYVELVSSENEPLLQEKFRLQQDGISGYIEIPQSILSGIYYLRVYTRWMKNMSPENYAYSRIKIVNPFESEVSQVSQVSREGPFQKLPRLTDPAEGKAIQVITDKRRYGQRSKVQMSLSINGMEIDNLAGLCLTVVRGAAMDTSDYFEYQINGSGVSQSDPEVYIPEIRGMAVTGEVIDKLEHRPMPNTRVQLSVIGEDPEYFGYLTGKDGKFYIAIPDYTGLKDFYISAETGASTEFEILIDKDFSTDFVDFRAGPFQLSDNERSLAEEMMMNVQVQNAYMDDNNSVDSTPVHQDKPSFYGEPFLTVKTDEYVKLPSLEEFIFEVIPTVTVIRTGGQKELKVFGDYSDLSMYKPLILLDHVAISDLSSILAVSPEKIDHIDVINASYIRGSINYGGIISIFSKKHDLAGVDLPGYSYFFGLKTLAIQEKISFPTYEKDKGDLREPDFRNCLIWLPDLDLDEDGSASAQFYTSDKKGEYLIYLRGITSDGRAISGTSKIYVE